MKLHRYQSYLSALALCSISILGGSFLVYHQDVSANIPEDYQANYGISNVREAITDDFISIQAKKKIGETPDSSLFQRLASNFAIVFPKLPQKTNYKITFEQCLLLSQRLTNSYTALTFDSFIDQCQ